MDDNSILKIASGWPGKRAFIADWEVEKLLKVAKGLSTIRGYQPLAPDQGLTPVQEGLYESFRNVCKLADWMGNAAFGGNDYREAAVDKAFNEGYRSMDELVLKLLLKGHEVAPTMKA
ncbi:MAG: hypothetical protein GWN58_28580 [Anaerolineae bacterium]|nr:hypothetical protein [Anaerolineae bacterium]